MSHQSIAWYKESLKNSNAYVARLKKEREMLDQKIQSLTEENEILDHQILCAEKQGLSEFDSDKFLRKQQSQLRALAPDTGEDKTQSDVPMPSREERTDMNNPVFTQTYEPLRSLYAPDNGSAYYYDSLGVKKVFYGENHWPSKSYWLVPKTNLSQQ